MARSPETLELPRGTQPTTPVASLTRPGGWFLQVGCGEACPPRLNCARALNAPPWTSLSPGQPGPWRGGGEVWGAASPCHSSLERLGGSTLPSLRHPEGKISGAITQNCASHPIPSPARPTQPAAAAPTGLLSSRALHVSVCLVLPQQPPTPMPGESHGCGRIIALPGTPSGKCSLQAGCFLGRVSPAETKR